MQPLACMVDVKKMATPANLTPPVALSFDIYDDQAQRAGS